MTGIWLVLMGLIAVGCQNGAAQQSVSDQTQSEADQAADLFVEDTRIIYQWVGERAGGEFGWVARIVGDIDKDEVLDFVTTAPSLNNGNGKIYVYSGHHGRLLFDVSGKQRERLGNGAAGAGDVDGDQVPDVIAGAPSGNAAYVYSGKTGRLLLKLPTKNSASGKFGYKVCGLGDADGDGHADVFVSAISASGRVANSGVCFAYSGKTGGELFQIAGERAGDKFGSAVCASRDGDDVMVAIGAQDAGTKRSGKVYVYRIRNLKPELAFEITGDTHSVNLGQMFVSFPGDANRDGAIDVYASDFSDNTRARGAGKVVVHSGKDGERLFAIEGQHAGEGFGTSPSEAGDVNGDGVGDLVVGAWQNRTGARSGGRVSLHDGTDGRELDAWTCQRAGDTFGFDAVGIGDVDGDGNIDFLLTSAWANVGGAKTGRVLVIAGGNYAETSADK